MDIYRYIWTYMAIYGFCRILFPIGLVWSPVWALCGATAIDADLGRALTILPSVSPYTVCLLT